MPRSRSGSRPSSRPASRPISMVLTTLSPVMSGLSEKLITKMTGFEEGEENFDICRDFIVTNILYHNFLEPHERDIASRFEGIKEKWAINADASKAEKLEQLLQRFNSALVFSEHHEQGDIKVRLLSLLLHLSNSSALSLPDSDIEDDLSFLGHQDVVDVKEIEKEKALEIRRLLAEGEDFDWSPPGSSDLSEWSSSSSDDDEAFDEQRDKSVKSGGKVRHVWLPGCTTPLVPPIPVSSIPHPLADCDVPKAEYWLSQNVLPQYWVKEADGRNKFPLRVTSRNDSALLLKRLEDYYLAAGRPVDENVKVSEYQVLRECLWTLRNPLCDDSPLFKFVQDKNAFIVNRDFCIPSLSPESLSSYLSSIGVAMTSLRRITTFIAQVFDRRQDDNVMNVRGKIGDDKKAALPPFTFESYADSLSGLLHLFSADLLQIENTVQQRKATFTLMDLKRELKCWFQLIDRLATFHKNFVDDQFLKTIGPYFRMISVWITQGRLEDWRNEFVFSANPKFCGKSFKRKLNDDQVPTDETFWQEGFICHPYKDTLAKLCLPVPQMFASTLPRILRCGKSIEILTRLQREDILSSAQNTLQDLIPLTKFQDDFFYNLKKMLSESSSVAKTMNIDADQSGTLDQSGTESVIDPSLSSTSDEQILSRLVNDVDDFDPFLVAAFEDILKNVEEATNSGSTDILSVKDDFLILSGFSLDPMVPISSKLEEALDPVVICHTDQACKKLVHLFRHTLQLEEHLAVIRRVFLLEAGDLILEFTTEIFSRLESLKSSRNVDPKSKTPTLWSERRSEFNLDPLTLTLFLHDCLGRRSSFSDAIYRFKVELDGDLLDKYQNANASLADLIDCLCIKYAVDWPLCSIISDTKSQKYNKIFVFLLKVKQALWNLQKIQAKELIEAVEKSKSNVKDATSDDDDENSGVVTNDGDQETLSNDAKIHRILLLRSWLLHFVGSMHSYFMSRVLHSTEIELKSNLSKCSDLDGLIAAHTCYVDLIFDRCFLHPSAAILKNGVLKILSICSALHDSCRKFVDYQLQVDDGFDLNDGAFSSQQTKPRCDVLIETKSLTQLEEEYARTHQFLASTLSEMTQKRNVAHLEGIAAMLVHSCPSVAESFA